MSTTCKNKYQTTFGFMDRTIIECTDCGQLLRVPNGSRFVACPKCSSNIALEFVQTNDEGVMFTRIPLMGLAHLQRDGQRVIALMGGGTAMIGDPSGKTEMRKMLTEKQLEDNVGKIKPQMERFLDFSGDSELINNSEWLRNLNYIDFLRDIGRHFSVNRMLSFETYKVRLETKYFIPASVDLRLSRLMEATT